MPAPEPQTGPPPKVHWFVQENIDEFTDVKTCRVTVGTHYTHSTIYIQSNTLYPFIELKNGDLRVGVLSGGKIKVPVGNVQLRIDDNKAWTITITETPLDYISPETTQYLKSPNEKTLNTEQSETTKKAVEAAVYQVHAAISPYTATTGEKAKQILDEMLKGKILKYRSISGNTQGTTGKYNLGSSLHTALKQCGIVP